MKHLRNITAKLHIESSQGSIDVCIGKMAFDSREVEKSTLFFAIKGTQKDGHAYIDKAIAAGANAVICEEFPAKIQAHICYLKVSDSRKALAVCASEFYANPSEKLKLIGITGTNGKTTIATLLYKLYKELGYKTGLISTIENRIHDRVIVATHTTPDPLQTNQLLLQMLQEGVDYCFMEVSSHAVEQHRITGLSFAGGIFTNLSHEHLDYHHSFDAYIKAKKAFFDNLPQHAFALANTDDKRGTVMLQNTRAAKHTYGLHGMPDFHCKIVENQFEGLQLLIGQQPVWVKLIGKFNAYNILAIYAAAVLLGEDKTRVLTIISSLETAAGRFEQICLENNIRVILDYAHTPDALKNVLETIAAIRTGQEQIISIVGAGGNRDKAKRPLMAEIACAKSNRVILTSDNPRDEDPDSIISDMQKGLSPAYKKKILAITNRKEAIKTAIALAQSGDIVLLAGKGHEKYQIIKGKSIPFDEKQIVKEALMIT